MKNYPDFNPHNLFSIYFNLSFNPINLYINLSPLSERILSLKQNSK